MSWDCVQRKFNIHAAFLHSLATYGPVRMLNAAKDLLHVREEQLGCR